MSRKSRDPGDFFPDSLLVSEIAPIDLLLQRLGRTHRHRRSGRPKGLAMPRVWLLQPPEENGLPRFGGGEFIYAR